MTDDWVTSALEDDEVVAELLLSMKFSSESWAPPPPPPPLEAPPGWTRHKPRSKPPARKEPDSTRFSPTTPLSWSGATASPSDGCNDESRSKCTDTKEGPGKRLKKKKTFAELKEEENLLLKEKMNLKKELETLRKTLQDQKARSEDLNKIKFDLGLQSTNKTGTISYEPGEASSSQPIPMETSSFNHPQMLPTHSTHDCPPLSNSFKVQNDVEPQERSFVLPDLNMTPSEEDSSF